MTIEEKSEIAEWYNGKSIFITGASGFMGKVLLEKLLYASPNIGNIYILMRNKRGIESEKRLEELWKLPMFQRLRESQPNALKKVIPVNGDVSLENLGLSTFHENLIIENVNVVFHCAAILKLNAELQDSVSMNVCGTQRVANLAKKIKNLKIFVHLSTAFCSSDIEVFMEKVYPSPQDPQDIIKITEWMNRESLKKITEDLIKPHPDTYTYTKRLAETLIAREAENMRVAIVRPSIVCPSINEPVPGWVDNINGPTGLLIAAGKGVLRSMYCKGNYPTQIIPVDLTINAVIAIAWKHGSTKEKAKEVPVYNLTNSGIFHRTWRDVLITGRKLVNEYPFKMILWYPDGDFRETKLAHYLCCLFFQWIPALFIDFLLLLFFQPRFMVKVQKKIYNNLGLFEFFTTREWRFDTKNFLQLIDEIKGKDKEVYSLDFNVLTPEEYMEVCVLGAREYVMKEDLSTIKRARIQMKIMYFIHKLCVYGFYIGMIYLLYSWFK